MQQVGAWILQSLTIPLPNEIKELIRNIPLAQYHIQLDKLIWPNSKGQCIMKEASKFIYAHEGIQFDKSRWKWIWKTSCPQKIQIFIWKCTHNRLPTCFFISHHQHGIGPECLRCLNLESTLHIIRDYP